MRIDWLDSQQLERSAGGSDEWTLFAPAQTLADALTAEGHELVGRAANLAGLRDHDTTPLATRAAVEHVLIGQTAGPIQVEPFSRDDRRVRLLHWLDGLSPDGAMSEPHDALKSPKTLAAPETFHGRAKRWIGWAGRQPPGVLAEWLRWALARPGQWGREAMLAGCGRAAPQSPPAIAENPNHKRPVAIWVVPCQQSARQLSVRHGVPSHAVEVVPEGLSPFWTSRSPPDWPDRVDCRGDILRELSTAPAMSADNRTTTERLGSALVMVMAVVSTHDDRPRACENQLARLAEVAARVDTELAAWPRRPGNRQLQTLWVVPLTGDLRRRLAANATGRHWLRQLTAHDAPSGRLRGWRIDNPAVSVSVGVTDTSDRHRARQRAARLITATDLTVCTSDQDPPARWVTAAMAGEVCPVVSGRCGAAGWIDEAQSGYIVADGRDTAAFADRVLKLVYSPSRFRLRVELRRLAPQLTARRWAEDLTALYGRLNRAYQASLESPSRGCHP